VSHGPTPSYIQSAREHGIAESELRRQLERLRSTPSFCVPEAPCTPGLGIQRWSEAEFGTWARHGATMDAQRVVRFVPASGAASRMFKALVARDKAAMEQLDARWDEFPFRSMAEATGPCGTREERWSAIVERLDLPGRPKGALPFHNEMGGVKTAFEAQLVEWSRTLEQPGATLHFTLPAEDMPARVEQLRALANLISVPVEASVQDPSTDTVALDAEGAPFLKPDGTPLFRPGGHGALLHNLAAISRAHPGALVSVKNIDNVRPTSALEQVVPWRQALIGRTEDLIASRNVALAALREGEVGPAQDWLRQGVAHPGEAIPPGASELWSMLDRPLLVAGMVQNEGEPGGGPFWLRDDRGVLRSQIVESAEMDVSDPVIQDRVGRATHFNPVDLVCAMHDDRGEPYDLEAFVDASRDFLVSKSFAGQPLKGLEHPGLWNGAMGRWNTVFVEVDLRTFAPVKTVFDLLRPAHRSE
jgi:hypothetical protein